MLGNPGNSDISGKVLPLLGSLRALGAGRLFLQLYLLHFLERSLKVEVLNSQCGIMCSHVVDCVGISIGEGRYCML